MSNKVVPFVPEEEELEEAEKESKADDKPFRSSTPVLSSTGSSSDGSLYERSSSVGSYGSLEDSDSVVSDLSRASVESNSSDRGEGAAKKKKKASKKSRKSRRSKRKKKKAGRFGSVAFALSHITSIGSWREKELAENEMLERNIAEAEAEINEDGDHPVQMLVLSFIEHWASELFMMILTVYALFGADCNQIYGHKDTDSAFGLFSLIVMAIFFLEMVLTCIAKPHTYPWSTYFWLDFVAAASLIGDVPWFNQEVVGNSFAAARAGRASKAGTRAARIVRVIRLIRLTRLIRLMKSMRGDNGENNDESMEDEKEEEEENASAISNRLSEFTTAKIIIGLLFMLLAMMLISPGDEDTTWDDGVRQFSDVCNAYEASVGSEDCNATCIRDIWYDASVDFVERHSEMTCVDGQCCDKTDILSFQIDGVALTFECNGTITIPNDALENDRRQNEIFETTFENITLVIDQKSIRDDEALGSILMTLFIIILLVVMMLSFQASYGKVNKDVVDPLILLTQEMNMVSMLEFEQTKMVPSDVVEVRDIQRTFLQMKNSLMSFALFAPRDVVVDMLSSGKEAALSVNEQEITVFFSHIDNFEELNQKTSSKKDLLIMLSKYFDVVTDAIADTNGTLLDFIGDMVLAIWNAPNSVENHAAKAMEACVLMQEHINESPALLDHEGKPIFEVSCGVNSGVAFVGNIGASVRMKYTVIGDPVNLASRIGGLNSRFHTFCVVSENIYNAPTVQDDFLLCNLDCVTVKGKTVGIRVFELVGRKSTATLTEANMCRIQNEAMQLYYDRKFEDAAEKFQEVLDICDHTGAKILKDRCVKYSKDPPPADWDGSEKMTQKHFH